MGAPTDPNDRTTEQFRADAGETSAATTRIAGKDAEARRRIITAVRAIPEGFVRTYGDVWPAAPRLAGRVLATVDAPGLPWWRVVRSDGSLALGPRQRAELEAEAVPFRPGRRDRVDLRVARLPPECE